MTRSRRGRHRANPDDTDALEVAPTFDMVIDGGQTVQ